MIIVKTYLQSITVRVEEWRLKQRDTEEWMRHRQLPSELRERVRRFIQYKWLATRGVNEESILQALPADLRRDIKRHLCLGLVRRVNAFTCLCQCIWNFYACLMDDGYHHFISAYTKLVYHHNNHEFMWYLFYVRSEHHSSSVVKENLGDLLLISRIHL